MKAMLETAFLFSLAAMTCFAAPVKAGDYLNSRTGRVTDACRSRDVLAFITSDFGYRASHYLKRDIAIAEIRDMRQKRLVLRDETRPVQREYCSATAITTDGKRRGLWYLIERGFGFAGMGSNIEFCLSGLDPWNVHGAQCASLR
ncbi:hypothetical protein [Rhizobium herbae]|uniref:Nuclease n=1 Tax=Rhizobium herbae TaxID=508661 RepID=A0ABS4ES68_9HYPH|nr:hypothetical protein [Rhizobium herbae]MBP1860784.1 hypothetical protein [Rhizobium herbae]